MKKHILLILVCALVLAILPAAAEDASPVAGDWYTGVDGVPYQLTLDAGGMYTLKGPGMEPHTGTWELLNGNICLDGSPEPELFLLEDKLCLGEEEAVFTREKPAGYTPAGPAESVLLTMFAGYWKCVYVDQDGEIVPAAVAEDVTDLYIEGHSAILGGPVLGDREVKLAFENGMLTCENEGASVQILLQADEYLRLTVTGSDAAPRIWYMRPAGTGEEE